MWEGVIQSPTGVLLGVKVGFLFVVGFFLICGAIAAVVIRFLGCMDARKARALEMSHLPRTVFLCGGKSLPDTPHVVLDVDSPAAFCESCGAPMEVRLARLSGYDSETGLPRYKLVRACPRAVLYEVSGVVWQADIRRHTVQGPTDTRMVLGVTVILLCVLVVFLVMPDTPPQVSSFSLRWG